MASLAISSSGSGCLMKRLVARQRGLVVESWSHVGDHPLNHESLGKNVEKRKAVLNRPSAQRAFDRPPDQSFELIKVSRV